MFISTLLIDLDDTIYPPSSGVWLEIGKRIEQYMQQRLGLPESQIHSHRVWFYNTYGTTLRGLKALYQIDEDDYLSFVHDVPLEDMLKPDPSLRTILLDLAYKKFIFTNADRNHADRVLRILNLSDCFDGIIDIKALDPYCKPLAGAYETALKIVDEVAERCVFIDDSTKNLAAAKQIGLKVVHVKPDKDDHHQNEYMRIASLLDLPFVLDRYETKDHSST